MDCGHIMNKKVRLLFNEFGGDGYYIWSCIKDYGYGKWGYYFDMNDEEELELFASEFCKMKLSLIKEVIKGCLRRGLFNETVAQVSNVLTSAMMQEVFIYATYDRRKKGSEFEIQEDWLMIELDLSDPTLMNIVIIPGKNEEIPGKNLQTKQNGNKTETKQEVVAPALPSPPVGRRKKENEEVREPYWQELVETWFSFGREKFGEQPSFTGKDPKLFKELLALLKKRAAHKGEVWDGGTAPKRLNAFLQAAFLDGWLSHNFLISNLVKQFDKVIQNQVNARFIKDDKVPAAVYIPVNTGKLANEIDYFYGMYCEEKITIISIDSSHYDYLKNKGLVNFSSDVIAALRLQVSEHMTEKNIEPDEKTFLKLMKKFGVLEYFKQKKLQEAVAS